MKNSKIFILLIFLVGIIISVFNSTFSLSQELLKKLDKKQKNSIWLINEAAKNKKININKASLYKAYAITNPSFLPQEFKSKTPVRCGTPVMKEIYKDWKNLDNKTKEKIEWLISPFNDRHFFKRAIGRSRITSLPTPPPGEPPLIVSYSYTHGHFVVFWTTTGLHALVYTSDNNGIEDWRRFTDWNEDGVWDAIINEPFTDWDDDGVWDQFIDEPFEDWNGNNIWDCVDEFTDWNENGSYDSSLDEPYEDSNDNGKYDTGETFTDYNDSGTRDTGLSEPIITDYNENEQYELGLSEPFTDYNENGQYELGLSEPFTDYNENGVQDNGIQEPSGDDVGRDGDPNTIDADGSQGNGIPEAGEPLIVDVNRNGRYDSADGDIYIDLNGDGIWQPGESNSAPDYVERFAEYFEESWDREVGAGGLGYDEPPGTEGSNHPDLGKDGLYYYVFIQQRGDGAYGESLRYNTISGIPGTAGEIASTFIVVNNNYNWAVNNDNTDGDDFDGDGIVEDFERRMAGAMKVTAAHEFFHAVKGGYDWMQDVSNGFWWDEATSVWMEDIVYNTVNDYRFFMGEPYTDTNNNGRYDIGENFINLNSYFNTTRDAGWFDEPQTSLTGTTGIHEYGTSIFAKFLSERPGGNNDTIRQTWDNAVGATESLFVSGDDWTGAIPTTLGGSDAFKNAFKNFTVANYRKDTSYGDGSLYPQIRVEQVYDSYPANISSTNLNCLSANYYKFRPSATFQTDRYRYTLYLRLTSSNVNRVWGARVILVRNDGITIQDEMNCDATTGVATYSVTNFGTTYNEVVIIASNIGTDSAAYSVRANIKAIRYEQHSLLDPTKTVISSSTKAKLLGEPSEPPSTIEDWFGNNDGNLDAGEGPNIKVTLKNIGTIELEDVESTISKGDDITKANVDFLGTWDPTYGTINASEEKEGGWGYWAHKVDPGLPKGTVLKFNLNITEKEETNYPDSFTVISDVDISLKYYSHNVKDGTNLSIGEYGNNNNLADAGELISIPTNIFNWGYSYSNKVKANLTTTSQYAKIYDTQEDYGNIGSLSFYSTRYNPIFSQNNYNILIASDAKNQTIPFNLTITDENVDAQGNTFSNTYTSTFNIIVSDTTDILPPAISHVEVSTTRNGQNVSGILRDGDKVSINADIVDGDLIDANGKNPAVTAKVYDSSNTVGATFTLNHGTSVSLNSGRYGDIYSEDWIIPTGLPDDTYTIKLTAKDNYGNEIPVAQEVVVLTRAIDTQPPDISNLLVSEPYISPSTSPNIKDKTTISATVSDANPNEWKITIKDGAGNVVREETFTLTTSSVQNISYEWNGTDKDNKFVKDGIYTFIIEVTDKVEHTKSVSFTVTIDNTPPVAHILFPYFSESSIQTIEAGMQIDIIGTAKDLNFKEYRIYHYPGIPDINTNWEEAVYVGDKKVENSLLYRWDITSLQEGIHSIKLIVEDKAGNSSSALRTFSLDKTAPQILSLNVSNNKITWVTSESGTSQIKIYTPTLYLSPNIDTYPEVENNFYWEGIDGSGIEVPDSIYEFELIFTDDAEHTVSKSSQITKYGIPKITSGPNINYTESYAEIITNFSEVAKDFSLNIGEQREFVLGDMSIIVSGTEYKVLWDYKNSYGNKVINGSYKFELTFMDLDNNIIKREGNITVNYGTPEVLLPEEGALVDPQYGAIESATTLTDKIELKRTFTNTTGILPEDNTVNILYQYGFYQPPPEPTEPTEFNITQYPPNKIKEEDGVYGFNISFSREIGEYVLKIANTKNNLMGVIQESEKRKGY